jgi:hypothetical protein
MAVKATVKEINGIALPTTTAPVYTVSGDIDRVGVQNARVVNHTAGKKTVNIYVVESGQTRGDEHKVISELQLAGNETRVLHELAGEGIGSNGSIDADADVATSCSISVTVTQFTS